MELKAGMWIAKGPEINVLLRVCGKSPILEIKGAIDLNYFFATGKAKLRLFIKRDFNLTMGHASLFASDVLKLIQKM